MKILFLTVLGINEISDRGVYSDLMRKFQNEGHDVYIITPLERRYRTKSNIVEKENVLILKIKTLNIQKTSALEKWLAYSVINCQFMWGIRKFLPGIKFDLIIYSTPPITFTPLIKYLKKKYGSVSYLLIKDIFPQNAVDLGLIKEGGLFHKYFVYKEKKLYLISDFIGCMSPANVDYLKKYNPEINPEKIEINPNSHELFDEYLSDEQKKMIRQKYNIPLNSTVFIYGGNLGKPQGVSFIIDFLDSQKEKPGVFFVIVGSGTEYKRMKLWFELRHPLNAMLLSELSKSDYNHLLQSSDVGMIFLDRRFTIPNFPSRLLSYLEYRLPVLAATDINTDLSKVILDNNFGLWSESGDLNTIDQNVTKLASEPDLRKIMGFNGFNFFLNNYTVNNSYNIIISHFIKDKES